VLELLRDVALSFCPESVRRIHWPHSSSRVLLIATVAGPVQTALCLWWLLAGYKAFLVARVAQFGHVMERANQTTQAWFVLVLFVEYVLFHPLALFLAYLAFEGFIRFVGAVGASEVVPSLPVVLAFKIQSYVRQRRTQREIQPLASVPDCMEVLSDGERLRISSALAKTSWHGSLTISINGEWYEVEREEPGLPPRSFVYILKRVPIGRVLRAYEEYDPRATL
jgi:hypothetical protein